MATAVIASRHCVQPLHKKRVNFYRGCLPQDLNRKDQSIKILFPYQDPLDSHQGATLDSYPLAALQERMWLQAATSFDYAPNGLDFEVWYGSRLTGSGYNGMYPWCSHNR